MQLKTNTMSAGGLALVLLAGSACGSYAAGNYDVGLSEDEEEATVIGELEQALNSDNSCLTPASNFTAEGQFPAFPGHVSPSSYGVQGCGNAYFVRIKALEASPEDDVFEHDHITPATLPTTESECLKSRLMIYVWGVLRTSGPLTRPFVYVGGRNEWGRWFESPTGRGCFFPNSDVVLQFDLEGGGTHDYKFAVSSRRYSTAGDTSSSFTTNPIRFAN